MLAEDDIRTDLSRRVAGVLAGKTVWIRPATKNPAIVREEMASMREAGGYDSLPFHGILPTEGGNRTRPSPSDR